MIKNNNEYLYVFHEYLYFFMHEFLLSWTMLTREGSSQKKVGDTHFKDKFISSSPLTPVLTIENLSVLARVKK